MNNRQEDLRHGLQGRLGHHAREPAGPPPAARDQGARGHAAPADLLRHAEDARPDGGRWTITCRAARRRPTTFGTRHRGHSGGQAAAAGLGDRREYDGLRRVPAEAEREEDQEVLPHLADHSRRGDVPAGAGAVVLRHRHPGRLRGPVPAGQLALHRLPRRQRRRARTTAPG